MFGVLWPSAGIALEHPRVAEPDDAGGAPIGKLPGYGRFFDAPNRMIEMIFAGVFDRFPELDVVFAEVDFGWVPYVKEQIDNNYQRLDPIEPTSACTMLPSEYIERALPLRLHDRHVRPAASRRRRRRADPVVERLPAHQRRLAVFVARRSSRDVAAVPAEEKALDPRGQRRSASTALPGSRPAVRDAGDRRRRHHARTAPMYERDGDWDDRHARGAGRAARPRDDPGDVAVVDDEGSAHVRPARCATRAASPGSWASAAWCPATSCRCSSRTGTRRSSLAVAVQSLGAVINPLLPNYRATRAGARLRDGRDPAVVFTPGELPRLRPPRARRRGRAARPASRPMHVVVGDGRRRRRRALRRRCSAAPDRRRSATGRRRRGLGADLHLGHRGDAQGDHAHRADGELQRARRVRRTSASSSRRRGVDAVAGRPLDRLQLRPALRALPRPAARAAGPVGPGRVGRASSRASGCTLHAGGDDVPAGSRGGSRAPRTCGSTRLRCFGCGGAPVPPDLVDAADGERASGCCASTARPRCWSARGTVRRRRPRQRAHTDGVRDEPRRGRGRRRRRRPCAPGEAGELFVRGPEHVRRLLRRPRAHRRDVRPDGWVRVGRHRHHRRATATSPWSAARRRSSSAAASTSPRARSRSCSSPSPRWSGRRWSACPTSGSASGRARASCCDPGAALDLETTVRRLRAAGLAALQAARAARGPRRVAGHGVGQDPEARDRRAIARRRARGTRR